MPVIIGRRELIAALGGAAVWPLTAHAQQGEKKYTIGIMSTGSEHAEIPALNAVFSRLCGSWDGLKGRTSFSSTATRRIGLNGCPNSRPTSSNAKWMLLLQQELSHHWRPSEPPRRFRS
jgi:hypothetical protein